MMSLLVVVLAAVGTPSAGAFNTNTKTPSRRLHAINDLITFRTSTSLFSSTAKRSTSTTNAVANKTGTRRAPKKSSKPTARSVAISALANAAASTYPSCSSNGAGAQVNAGSFATRQLEQDSNFKLLEQRDRAFARLLVATVERRSGQIDKVLKSCIDKYPPKKGKHSHVIQATLRTGLAQLIFLQTPPFAAIKESVQVLRMYPNNVPEPMIKFVNGVLRNLSRPPAGEDDTSDSAEIMLGQKLLKEKTSSQDNIAPWLLKRWENDWGKEKAMLICEEMMPSDDSLKTSRIDLSTKYSLGTLTGIKEDEEKLQSLISNLGEDSILLPQCSIRVGPSLKGDVKNWPEYDDGTWWVQDASSTLPALVLTRTLYDKYPRDELSDIHVVDMCAAPGGKTSQLLSAGFGHVTAIEASPRRSRRLLENLERLGLVDRCQVVVEEGQNWTPTTENTIVHGILLDVPCSATGTGARRPDVLRRDSDLEELLKTQEMLANHCADNFLDVGGILVYATCSILKEESEDQVQKLIGRGNVETQPIQPHEVPGFEDAIDENGWLRVLPGVLKGDLRSTDGFFVARLVKN